MVAIHCYYFNTQNFITISPDSLSADIVRHAIDFVSIVITDCAVPLFFIISGYLFFYKNKGIINKQLYTTILKKKVNSLMIPYLLWNIVAVLLIPQRFFGASLIEKIFGFWSTDPAHSSGPWDSPLWFIRDLFIVMLFSPLISYLTRRFKLVFLSVLVIIYYFHSKSFLPGISIVSWLFFSIGAYLAIVKSDFSKGLTPNLCRYIYIIAVLVGLMRFGTFYHIYNCDAVRHIINFLWIMVSATAYYCIAQRVAKRTHYFAQWKYLGASSFVVFAMHSLIIGYISSGLLRIIGKMNMTPWLTMICYFITIVISVAICFITHIIISKNKRLSMLFEGGRKR